MDTAKVTLALLESMQSDLIEAVGLIGAIKKEFADNGNDSLANIDYGAALNTALIRANAIFNDLDNVGLFTMGND